MIHPPRCGWSRVSCAAARTAQPAAHLHLYTFAKRTQGEIAQRRKTFRGLGIRVEKSRVGRSRRRQRAIQSGLGLGIEEVEARIGEMECRRLSLGGRLLS